MKNSIPTGQDSSTLSSLEDRDEFIMRHIGPRDEHVRHMLVRNRHRFPG